MALAVAGLRKAFPGSPAPVLDGVDLAVDRGSLVHVAGANGAGKTTLLRLLAGLLDPDDGTIRLEGVDPIRDRRSYQRRVAYVSAGGTGLYARLTVRRHLEVWARMAFVPAAETPRRIYGTLAAFGLRDLGTRRVDRLSMGQRQRLRLALALLPDTAVLLLDEPESSLDAEGVGMLAAAVRARLAMGAAAIWCSPEATGVPLPAERVAISGGRLGAR